ncbi:MAG TPA: hypothetical protein VFN03_03105 [Trueperaceae bacterium]|nr:hypothetical protein [Trueperaceae bacterium]
MERSDVTAVFDHPSAAQDAGRALADAGFGQGEVSIVAGESDEIVRARRLASPNETERAIVPPDVGAAAGFMLGFLGGGFLGLLLGTGTLQIMGVGPAMAAGPFLSAAIGAVVLGLGGAFAGYVFNAPLPTLEPAPLVHGSPRPVSRTILRVGANPERVNELVDLLNRFSPQQVSVWRSNDGDWIPA